LAAQIASLLPVESGFASIALTWNRMTTTTSQMAPPAAAPVVLQNPGLDLLDDPISLGEQCRGAQWLTFLGPGLVERLGGKSTLLSALDRAVQCRAAGECLLLRAGDAPLANPRAAQVRMLKSIAKA